MKFNQFTFHYADIYSMYLIILIIASLCLMSLSRRPIDTQISVKNSDFLKGVFILMVVIHHLLQRCNGNGSIIDRAIRSLYTNMGFLSVGMFFFLSAYGLSASRRKIQMFTFLKLKLFRVYAPCVIVNFAVAIIAQKPLASSFNPTQFDGTQWFVVAILFFYLCDYITIWINKGLLPIYAFTLLWLIVCKQLELGAYWYWSTLCFPLGYIWHNKRDHITQYVSGRFFLLLISLFTLLLSAYLIQRQFDAGYMITAVLFCLCILLIVAKFNPSNTFLNAIGKSSLEIYVLHMKFAWLLNYATSNKITNSTPLIAYFSLLILSGVLFSKFNNLILSKIKQGR